MDPINGFVAALQTKTSIFPKSLFVSSTRLCICDSSPILAAIGKATSWPINVLISSAVALQASIFLLDIITFAHSLAACKAIDFPIPLEEPVIKNDLFFKLNNDI